MDNFFQNLSLKRSDTWTVLAFLSVPIIGGLDFITGQEVTLAPFYFVPVAFMVWNSSFAVTLSGTVLSAIVWFVVDTPALSSSHGLLLAAWNLTVRLLELTAVVLVLESLKRSLARERNLSRVDSLTGAANARAFMETIESELNRVGRHGRAFTLAYIDVDHFKTVNDSLGHHAGDGLLRLIAATISSTLRPSDTLARLGGDEFAVLLPETDAGNARVVLERVRSRLAQVVQADRITFSIGVLTCLQTPTTANQVLEMADQLMYLVKHNGRNGIKYALYPKYDDVSNQKLETKITNPKFSA